MRKDAGSSLTFCGRGSSRTPPLSPSTISNASTASLSPQHGSPDSDKLSPELYPTPSTASSPTPDPSTQNDYGRQSILTVLQRHTFHWSRPGGAVKGGPEVLVLRDKNSRLPNTPSLSETQDGDSQAVNLPPSPDPENLQLSPSQRDPASPDPSKHKDMHITSGQPDGESRADEYDGWIRFGFIRAVKTVVYDLLYHAITKFMRDKCYGCINDCPSPRDHECFEPFEDRFYESNYYGVMQVLYNERFIGAVQRFLAARNIHQDSSIVSAVTQAYLYELTLVKQVFHPINELYAQMIDENPEVRVQLLDALQYWRGC